jgi:hypothetical protein
LDGQQLAAAIPGARSGHDPGVRAHVDKPRGRRGAVLAGAGTALAAVLAATAFGATTSGPVAVRDAAGDARPGAPDLTRVQLGRAPDGRLRAALTLTAPLTAKDLLAADGPPGSVCVRLWTTGKPGEADADRLVCITADREGRHLRASVVDEGPDGLPRRVGAASLARSSERTIVVRFSQSAAGRPDRVSFEGEATKPGCTRTSCVDTAPDAPAAGLLVLHDR